MKLLKIILLLVLFVKINSFVVLRFLLKLLFENGEFVRKNIFKRNFPKDREKNWKKSFMNTLIIYEKIFIIYNLCGRLLIYVQIQ